MPFKRNRIIYGLLMIGTLFLGLASRYLLGEIVFVRAYVGDVLWALMVYFGFATLFNHRSARTIGLATLLFSFGIEISQLYHALWIDNLRSTRLGGLVLGFTFVWSDLVCYSIGVGIGWVIETYLIPDHYKLNDTPASE